MAAESKYPELDEVAKKISRQTLEVINGVDVNSIKSEMPYKRQYILEKIIEMLEEKV